MKFSGDIHSKFPFFSFQIPFLLNWCGNSAYVEYSLILYFPLIVHYIVPISKCRGATRLVPPDDLYYHCTSVSISHKRVLNFEDLFFVQIVVILKIIFNFPLLFCFEILYKCKLKMTTLSDFYLYYSFYN